MSRIADPGGVAVATLPLVSGTVTIGCAEPDCKGMVLPKLPNECVEATALDVGGSPAPPQANCPEPKIADPGGATVATLPTDSNGTVAIGCPEPEAGIGCNGMVLPKLERACVQATARDVGGGPYAVAMLDWDPIPAVGMFPATPKYPSWPYGSDGNAGDNVPEW
mmetsp:Transcript_7163/g.16055  ORF Transcript_7163/g.16055 Transcript_7163/m.16055 type:complete len:165 (+) Transcript_7163:1377-1871(+)